MRVKKNYNCICIDCGATFVAHQPKALRCPTCKTEHLRTLRREFSRKIRAEERRTINQKTRYAPSLPIVETIIACEKYNREHGTRLSYGQFVSQFL